MKNIVFVHLSLLIFSFAIGYFVNRFVYRKSLRYNLRKSNITAIRWENQSKPIFGGISFYVIFIITVLYYLFSYGRTGFDNSHLLPCILIITLSFCMGLADDLLNTSPYFKFIVQFINASILIYFGLYIQISTSQAFNYIITYVWVIGIMNSINMLDNMDAITSLIAIAILIASLVLIYFEASVNSTFSTYIIVSAIGVLISFIVFFNWNPSIMYMGDNGSQFIGALLAIVGILYFWNSGDETIGLITLKPVYASVLAFIIPISDTATVTINRLLRKQSPFVGGKDHTTHHLAYAGLSDRKVVLLLASISIISLSFSVYLIRSKSYFTNFQIVIFAAFIVVVFASLYAVTKITKPH